jgi:hypothetical protein
VTFAPPAPPVIRRSHARDLRALFAALANVVSRGGLVAATFTLVVAPLAAVASVLAVAWCIQPLTRIASAPEGSFFFLSTGPALLLAIAGSLASIFVPLAFTTAGALTAFLVAASGQQPTLADAFRLAFARARTLGWFLCASVVSQAAIAGLGIYFGPIPALVGLVVAFLHLARFQTLGMAWSAAEGTSFDVTVERTWELGRGRLPLLLVAAGLPKAAQALALVGVGFRHGWAALAILAVGIVVQAAFAVAALAVVTERRA